MTEQKVSAPVLTVDEVAMLRAACGQVDDVVRWDQSGAELCESHESLRAERDAVNAGWQATSAALLAEIDRRDAAEQERDALLLRVALLAAECREWRAWDWTGPLDVGDRLEYERALEAARVATDAAGALDGGGK